MEIVAGVVLLLVVILILIVVSIASRYKVAGANEALILSGRRERGGTDEEGLKVVRGGGLFVFPLVHRLGRLSLTARQINVSLSDAVTSQGIKVLLEGVATFKVGADETSIRNAAERFLDTDPREVDDIVKNVLEGSLRSIVGTLTVEELNLDRQKFQQAVQSAAIGDLATSGLLIDSFTIQAIGGEALEYMELVGQQELSRRERDARMAKATADREASVREAEAQKLVLDAERGVALREADVKKETEAAHARAGQSGPLAEAQATQEVIREKTQLAELEAERVAKELLATTVRPAEAEAEAVVKRAEGDRAAAIAAAQAEAEQTKLSGQAEALIVLTKGEAEAKALEMQADAYRHFNDAAILATVLRGLPDIVAAAAEPVGKIKSLTVLSTDGASEIVRTATGNLSQASTAIKGLTGIDIPSILSDALQSGEDDEPGGRTVGTPATDPSGTAVTRTAAATESDTGDTAGVTTAAESAMPPAESAASPADDSATTVDDAATSPPRTRRRRRSAS